MKDVSIIIPVKNDVKNIRVAVESVLRQTKKPSEVIIVDGASKDGTIENIKDLPVKIIIEPRPGGALARNIGIKRSKGKSLIFTDSDCDASPHWIKEHLKALKKYDAVMGKVVIHPEVRDSLIAKSLEYGLLPYFDFPFFDKNYETLPFWNLYTSNFSLNRKILKDVGMMDEDFKMVGSEDIEFGYRICEKYKIGYAPKAVIYHKHKTTFNAALYRAIIEGRQSRFLGFKTGEKNRRAIPFSRFKKLLMFKNLSIFDKIGIFILSAIYFAGFLYGYATFKKLYDF